MHVLLTKVIQMVTRLNQTDCKETDTDTFVYIEIALGQLDKLVCRTC